MSAVKISSLGRRGGVIAVADGADGAEGAAEVAAAEVEAEVEAAAPLSKCLLKKKFK